MASLADRASRFVAVWATLGIASVAIVVWDILDWFAITAVPARVSDVAPAAAALAFMSTGMVIYGLYLRSARNPHRGVVGVIDVSQVVPDFPPQDFELYYSRPYKLIAPLCLVLGISFPLLRRYVEWRQIGPGDWVIGSLFVLLGGMAAIHFGRVVSISKNTIEFRSMFAKTSLPWDQIVKVEITNGKFRLGSTSGQRQSVDMSMVNATAFARELDARFDGEGVRRHHVA